MAQILEPKPGLANLAGRGLGAGIEKGVASAAKSLPELLNPLRRMQQDRLAQDAVLKPIVTRIKMINEALKNTYNPSAAQPLIQERTALEAQYTKLAGLDYQQEEPKTSAKKKEKFNAKNKKHFERRAEVLKKTGDNREKAQKILAEEFDL